MLKRHARSVRHPANFKYAGRSRVQQERQLPSPLPYPKMIHCFIRLIPEPFLSLPGCPWLPLEFAHVLEQPMP